MIQRTIPSNLHADPLLRQRLFDFFLDTSTSAELAAWLRDIGQDSQGTAEARKQRVRAHSKYLTMPVSDFPSQTEHYLSIYSAGHLADLCGALGLPTEGNKDTLYRRIMRHVHLREGWVPEITRDGPVPWTVGQVAPYLAWMPIQKRGRYERDFYPIIWDELAEVFGNVYEQLPIAHGSTLKIDFHVGDPLGNGVGIEVKMPENSGEVQRALGQVDQYARRYGENLILLIFNDLLKPEIERFLLEELTRKSVSVVVR